MSRRKTKVKNSAGSAARNINAKVPKCKSSEFRIPGMCAR
jgi:hypothetical protein